MDCILICKKKIDCRSVQLDGNKCTLYKNISCSSQSVNGNFWSKDFDSNKAFYDCSGKKE